MLRKEVLVLLIILVGLIVFSPSSIANEHGENASADVNVVGCFAEYKCGAWGECVDLFQTRVCEDKECDMRDIVERRLCEEIADCRPDLVCEDWSSCIYTDNVDNIISGEVKFGGSRNRLCVDLNGCVKNFVQESVCEEEFNFQFIRIKECNEEFLIATNIETGAQVVKISIDAWKEQRLNIVTSQSKTVYCSTCYNGVKDDNEERID